MNEVQARNLTPDELMGCLDEQFGEWAKPVELMVQKLEWKIGDLEDEVHRFENLSTSLNATLNNVKKLLTDDGLMHEEQIEQAIELIEKSQKQWRDLGEWV